MTDISTKVYTLREFRANTKQAFDNAQELDVIITRGKQRFYLITESYMDELLSPDAEITAQPLATIENVIKQVKPDFTTSFCKHGVDPKFCKHAKPGKPCK